MSPTSFCVDCKRTRSLVPLELAPRLKPSQRPVKRHFVSRINLRGPPHKAHYFSITDLTLAFGD